MKHIFFLLSIILFFSCSPKKDNSQTSTTEISDSTFSKTPKDTIKIPAKDTLMITPENSKKIKEIPADGTYRYDMSFAEFQGQTMGEKVTVIIKGDSIKIVYEGDGRLTTAKGTILDQGILVKHKSGVWIIARTIKDAALDEFGGCSGGPTVIDFVHKKYKSC